MAEPTPAQGTPSQGWGPPGRPRRRDGGGMVFGVILLLVGGYFLLTDTLGINLPDIGEFWPLFVIGLGVWILASSLRREQH
jgi:cell wall-active antibiotic response 4TMS protein YvqF